jgi:CDP-6-deoxy-D-xylo-4-hexulose-3-dehydrase
MGATPVFIDVELSTYVPTADEILSAVSKNTRAIVLAHTLGNHWPVKEIVKKLAGSGIAIVEDNCDALGSQHAGQRTGSFGDFATQSFYPAHQITTGEGGALLLDRPVLTKVALSLRDWGRDCWCEPGAADTCGKRFDQAFPLLPPGFDHKYVYSRLGYNLKATEMQAAIGLGQMEKVEQFRTARRMNFARLFGHLQSVSANERVILPRATELSAPSWFGFPITLGPGAPPRALVIQRLQAANIDTRMLFAGDMRAHPALEHRVVRSIGPLPNTSRILRDTFWLGVWPGIPAEAIDYMAEKLVKAVTDEN